MATPIVSFGGSFGGFVNTASITGQNVGSGANRVAYVMIGATNVNDNPTGVSVGTDTLTAQGGGIFADASGWKWRLYAGVLTVTGSQTVTATWDNTFNQKQIVGLVMPDVDTAGALLEDLTTANFLTSTQQPNWTIDSATGDTVVGLYVVDEARDASATSPAVELTGTGLGGTVIVHGMYEAGATSVTIDGNVPAPTTAWRGYGFNVPAGGPAGPVLTAPTGVATGTTTATIGATTDTASGTIYGVVTTSATAPTTTQIAAGQDHTGATAAASGNTGTLTTSGTKTINVTGLTASTTYRAHLYHDDASGDSAVVTSAAFITDVTSPSLSAQTASSAAPLTCQGSVSTNEGNGTLYAVVTASATAPSAAQVKAGQDHTGSAALRVISQAVSGTGTQSIASGSVTAGTRYMHFMHEDAAANQSAVVSSASFVVAATFTITTDALEDETGAVLASVTLTRAYAIRLSDHTLVASWASPATNGSGQLVLADAALTAVPHLLATVSNSNADAGAKVYTPG